MSIIKGKIEHAREHRPGTMQQGEPIDTSGPEWTTTVFGELMDEPNMTRDTKEPRRWHIQDFPNFSIGVWRRIWASRDPLPLQLETREFGDVVVVVEAKDYDRLKAAFDVLEKAMHKIGYTIDSSPTDSSGSGPCRLAMANSRNRRILEAQGALAEARKILEGEK